MSAGTVCRDCAYVGYHCDDCACCAEPVNAVSLPASILDARETLGLASASASVTRSACNMTQPRRIVQDRAEQDLDVRPDSQASASNPRRMVAVTVALSEPMDSTPLDWSSTIASVLRLTYAGTTVEVIDSWSPSELARVKGSSGRVDA